MKKRLIELIIVSVLVTLSFVSCKKDKATPLGSLKVGITDTRSDQKSTNGIIDASKLTKYELTISRVDLQTSNGTLTVLDQPTTVDLRNYKGIVKDLATAEIPRGNYQGIILYFTGVTITYDGNTYSSIVGVGSSLTLADLPGITFTSADGVPDLFTTQLGIAIVFSFDLTDSLSNRNLNIALDAVASCEEIAFPCTPCGGTQYFANLRTALSVSYYFEEGIEEIRHSPPFGIQLNSGTTANYYGIHTFVDFNGSGGTINSHTSQHFFRGADGLLFVEAESQATNSSLLTPNIISGAGQTDVKANEVFNFGTIQSNLKGKGINLETGKKYYFSLKKTWNITSGGKTYSISRVCEPIPVLWPSLAK